MNNSIQELDYARDILTTYRQVNDESSKRSRFFQTKLQHKNKELETELQSLKEQYSKLQDELSHRDERLARLNRQLIDRTTTMTRLQEDFENVIFQLSQKNI